MADRFEAEGWSADGQEVGDSALDEKLNAALALYADPSERVNPSLLASRVIGECEHARPWSVWVAALSPTLACLVLAALFALHWMERPGARNRRANIASPGAALHSEPGSSFHAQPPHPLIVAGLRERARGATHCPIQASINGARLPKLDQFPAPSPLTPEEEALLAVAMRGDRAAQQAVAQASKPAEPLHIAELRIPPLDPEFPSTSTPPQGAHHAERR